MISVDEQQQIGNRWRTVQEEVAAATAAAGRAADSVRIVGVTKYVDVDAIAALVAAGCCDLGESRPQQLWERAAALQDDKLHWHLIGHLQTNKVAKTLPFVSLIHAVDSLRLLDAIETAAAAQARTIDALLEIKVSQDQAKHGFDADSFASIAERCSMLQHVRIKGLMTMASLDGGPVQARRDFERLRELRDRWQIQWPSLDLSELSIGMSDDFPQAIAAGATIVRIGSRLWY